jgi:hypothetical protein
MPDQLHGNNAANAMPNNVHAANAMPNGNVSPGTGSNDVQWINFDN